MNGSRRVLQPAPDVQCLLWKRRHFSFCAGHCPSTWKDLEWCDRISPPATSRVQWTCKCSEVEPLQWLLLQWLTSTMREDVEHKTMPARPQPTACLPRKLVMVFEQRSDDELIAMRVHELCCHREFHDRSRRVQVACHRSGRVSSGWSVSS